MQFDEHALMFSCQGENLFGILSLPERCGPRGVLIVVGGPQYRSGSHRQFTLLARCLADHGIPALRFDYRGMGDSEGRPRNFEQVGDDLRAAIDQFEATVPGMTEVVIWGLCDAASAALFYASEDRRVSGLVLLNPWVRTVDGLARATLKHYYRDRLLRPELWRKVLAGRFDYAAAAGSLWRTFGMAAARRSPARQEQAALPDRMYAGLDRFGGKVLLITSGADLTAQEFVEMVMASRSWQRLLAATRVTRQQLPQADHTFSRRAWRDQVADWTVQWMRSW